MYKKITFLMLSSSILAPVSIAMAAPTEPTKTNHEYSWVTTVSAGPIWAQGGNQQTFYLTPTIEKTYSSQNSTQAIFESEIFLGIQKTLNKTFIGQLGVAVEGTSPTQIEGEMWTDADPMFNNHSYSYNVQHTLVALKGKLLTELSHGLLPWVSGSLGVGINTASSFTNTSLVCGELPTPNFASQTTTSLAYTLGVGIQKTLDQHVQVGVSYEFADWGKSELGKAPQQTLNNGLKVSHFYTNGLLFNITYIA